MRRMRSHGKRQKHGADAVQLSGKDYALALRRLYGPAVHSDPPRKAAPVAKGEKSK